MEFLKMLLELLPVIIPLIKELINKDAERRQEVVSMYADAAKASRDPVAMAIVSSIGCIAERWTEEQLQAFASDLEKAQASLSSYSSYLAQQGAGGEA